MLIFFRALPKRLNMCIYIAANSRLYLSYCHFNLLQKSTTNDIFLLSWTWKPSHIKKQQQNKRGSYWNSFFVVSQQTNFFNSLYIRIDFTFTQCVVLLNFKFSSTWSKLQIKRGVLHAFLRCVTVFFDFSSCATFDFEWPRNWKARSKTHWSG